MHIYDLVIPIGIACRPAMQLIASDLRFESYPLDWQMGYSLETVVHLFKTKFEDFFVNIEEDKNQSENHVNRWIRDVDNEIISIHHYPKNVDVYVTQRFFIESMRNRFFRLHERLLASSKIAMISNRDDQLDALKFFLKEFSVLYPHLEITYINIRDDEKKESSKYEVHTYSLNDKLSIIEYVFNDTFDDNTGEKYNSRGNDLIWEQILSDLRVKECMRESCEFKAKHNPVVIYGAGKRCYLLLRKLKKSNISIKGIAVTTISENPSKLGIYSVKQIMDFSVEDHIVISLNDENEARKIRNNLSKMGYKNLIMVDRNLRFFEC